mgnify:CR=1 FL=1
MCFKNAAKAAKSAGAVKDMHKKTPQAIEKYIANGRDASKLVRSWSGWMRPIYRPKGL